MIRFYLDENIDPLVAKALNSEGIETLTPGDVPMLGAGDPSQFAFALKNNLVLVTKDDDFLRLAKREPNHAGIVFFLEQYTRGPMIDALRLVHGTSSVEQMQGQVEYL